MTAVEFLDDIVDANAYVADVPELEEAAQSSRRIGLGYMGLADALAKLGLRYGSDEALDFCSQLIEFTRFHAMLASIDRARQRGPFPWISGSIYDPDQLSKHGPGAEYVGQDVDGNDFTARLWAPPSSLVAHERDFARPAIDWNEVVDGLTRYGIRNATQLTFAPTGTISSVAGMEGGGCEPLFALVYGRLVVTGDKFRRLTYRSALFDEALRRAGVDDDTRTQIDGLVTANDGSCQGIDLVPIGVREAFVTAADVTPEQHVRTQAVLQAWVDSAISKTINLPSSATPDDVGRAYRLAHELGCKGITVYRQGSRNVEVLRAATRLPAHSGDRAIIDRDHWPVLTPMPIPDSAPLEGLQARVFPVPTPHGHLQVTITELPEHPGRPFDVRLTAGRAASELATHTEAVGRLVSVALRVGASVESIVEQLLGIGSEGAAESTGSEGADKSTGSEGADKSTGSEGAVAGSAADAVGRLLARLYLSSPSGAEPESIDIRYDPTLICPSCRQPTLVYQSGCRRCEPLLGGCGQYAGCD